LLFQAARAVPTQSKENAVSNVKVDPAVEKKLKAELSEVKGDLDELKKTLTSMETERDFYYGKLQKIELLCQQSEQTAFVQSVLDVMYGEE
tara:strand:+ start:336 stop:608 length:273 start_codon:yes stop_codon:yes gene_type:complete